METDTFCKNVKGMIIYYILCKLKEDGTLYYIPVLYYSFIEYFTRKKKQKIEKVPMIVILFI